MNDFKEVIQWGAARVDEFGEEHSSITVRNAASIGRNRR